MVLDFSDRSRILVVEEPPEGPTLEAAAAAVAAEPLVYHPTDAWWSGCGEPHRP